MQKVVITGHDLTVDQIIAVCREGAEVVLSDESREKILASRQVVNELVEERKVVYGITTGFGKFSDVVISQDECKLLQKNLIITQGHGQELIKAPGGKQERQPPGRDPRTGRLFPALLPADPRSQQGRGQLCGRPCGHRDQCRYG